jgi:hypothetical protein
MLTIHGLAHFSFRLPLCAAHPDEVLQHIAEELPVSEKQRLRGVSSSFLCAALKDKYGCVRVNFDQREALTVTGRARRVFSSTCLQISELTTLCQRFFRFALCSSS